MERLAADGGKPVRKEAFPVWPVTGEEEERLVLEVVRSGKWGGSGTRIKLPELEEKFAAMHGAKHAVTLVNGTLGLTVALQAAGVEPGDEVIMPPYTFIATASSTLLFGAVPVFADVEPDSMNLDADRLEEVITPRTKAVVAVHLAGAPANMDKITAIARKHGLAVIEDAAQAVGASWDGRPAGSLGDLASFSFQLGKNVTSGEGGIILGSDDKRMDAVWSLVNVGRIKQGGWYQHERIGWNLRMTEFQAAVLLGQLSRFEEQFRKRERNARRLTELLNGIEGIRVLPRDPRVTRHAYHLFLFGLQPELEERIGKADFIARVQAEGIPVHPGYVSLNRNKAVRAAVTRLTGQEREVTCPVSERFSDRLGMWLHQNVLLAGDSDMQDIAEAVRKVAEWARAR
ncbi:DegT/DnrJ/EryC1/StrS family aminotransferase [Paenibacillus sp. CC-CFT747]|nr:DegT/DnrJ/EryC1/StrS family aminotransferase [Paenibacillus sp. CC-CFT747]